MIPRRVAAWAVHFYTALGIPLAYLAVDALADGDGPKYLLIACIAAFVDGTDGMLARAAKVKEVLPEFSGRRLDDIIDYIHFVCLPLMALPALGMIPAEHAWIVVMPLMASAYGFCQEAAKTEESFVGFPSYWNVMALYFYVLHASPGSIVGWLVFLSVMVFVPIHYVYPSKTRFMQPVTLAFGTIWSLAMFALALAPNATWAPRLAIASMVFPLYYAVLSGFHHVRVHRELEQV